MLGVQNKTADKRSVSDHTGGSISSWKFPRLRLMSSRVTDAWSMAKAETKKPGYSGTATFLQQKVDSVHQPEGTLETNNGYFLKRAKLLNIRATTQ